MQQEWKNRTAKIIKGSKSNTRRLLERPPKRWAHSYTTLFQEELVYRGRSTYITSQKTGKGGGEEDIISL